MDLTRLLENFQKFMLVQQPYIINHKVKHISNIKKISNRELLPVHFGYDPGKDYDWSRFPDTRPPELIEQEEIQNNKNQKNNNTNMIDASNNNNNNTSNNEGAAIELSRDERMFLIQRYLDIVKLELYDPGPAATVKRTANVATNSSGMRVNIVNINVPPPIYHFPVQRNEPNRSSKSFRQKFLNMFKKVPTLTILFES